MRLLVISLILIFISIQTSFGQDPAKRSISADTLRENIIYEYDTVYLAPDTLRLTDTLIISTKNDVRSQNPKQDFSSSLKKRTSQVSHNTSHHFCVLAGISPVLMIPFKKTYSDSLKAEGRICFRYNAGLEYNTRNFIASVNFGYYKLHERSYITKSSYITEPLNRIEYDSLLVIRTGTSHNHYNCLNIGLSAGRLFKSKNLYLAVSISAILDIILNYQGFKPSSTGDFLKISQTSLTKTSYSFAISPYLGIPLRKHMDFFINPYYSIKVSESKLYPLMVPSKIGVLLGLKLFL